MNPGIDDNIEVHWILILTDKQEMVNADGINQENANISVLIIDND